MLRTARALISILAAFMLTTALAEGIEYALVTSAIGAGADPALYFATRNRMPVVLLKFIYNPAAAFLGGWLIAHLAQRADVRAVALIAAVLQALGFLWGMLASQYAGTAPLWAWPIWLVLTSAGLCFGAHFALHRRTSGSAAAIAH